MKKIFVVLFLFCSIIAYSQTWTEGSTGTWTVITKEDWDRLLRQYKEDYGFCHFNYIDVLEMDSRRKVTSGTRPNFNGYYYLIKPGRSTLAYGNSKTGRIEIEFVIDTELYGMVYGYLGGLKVNSTEFTRLYNLYINRVNIETVQSSNFNTETSQTTQNIQFTSEKDFQVEREGDGVKIIKYFGYETEIRIPPRIQNYPVTNIGANAFKSSRLTSVVIPNSVTSIGDYAFCDCTSLANINISNSVTSIGAYVFKGCIKLTSIIIPNSVTSIGDYAFCDCTSLVSINIPNSVTSISDYTFYDCTSLVSINIPNRVNSIGSYAFYDCTSLVSINIPNSVTSIGNYAFCYCTSLTSINIPNRFTSISDYTFYDCTSLASVNIPNSVNSIGSYAFNYCTSLTSVTFNGTIISSRFNNAFDGDLREKFYVTDTTNGTPGTYTRLNGESKIWTKR